MIITNKRRSRRFDRPFFVQFRQLKGLASYSLGMTSNISSDGFCFQFQNIELKQGDNLEFKFNNQQTKQSVHFFGDVMWTQKNDMKYIAGIRFCMSDKKNRKKMLKIISDFFTIPLDQLTYRHDKKSSEHVRSKKAVSETDQVHGNLSSYWKHIIKKGIKICMHLVILAVITTAFVLVMPVLTEQYEHLTKPPVESHVQTVVYDNSVNDTSKSMSVHQIRDAIRSEYDESEKLFFADKHSDLEVKKGSSNVTAIEKGMELTHTQPTQSESENFKFYVQVTSPYDPEHAYEMLLKIKNYYPDAFLFKINDYYKIRIPGITSEKQGTEVNKDLEDKLNVKSVLVYRLK
ncbi:MAG: PilZ domain-containing protein [Nitrospiraceae bacterium]|nr:MAG: PilZ domain-containing protein [Nitrospiraceae bacterium]